MRKFTYFLSFLLLLGCAPKGQEGMQLFLPKVEETQSAELVAIRDRLCSPAQVSFRDGILSESNFKDVFNCANYDGRLEPLRKLIESPQFPKFVSSVNLIIQSSSTKNIKDLLKPWFMEDEKGNSKIDRLLPVIKAMIQNPAFQDSLPVLHSMLDAGVPVWQVVLPRLGDVIYNERFPDTFIDLGLLWDWQMGQTSQTGKTDMATSIKKLARYLKRTVNSQETVAMRLLEAADTIGDIEPANLQLLAYLDQANVKGVFTSLMQSSGDLRGEKINPDLNSDPDDDEAGVPYTPEERQHRVYLKLFQGGQDAPIYHLLGLVNEFEQSHPKFLQSVSGWFGDNSERLQSSFFRYIAGFFVSNDAVTAIKIDDYLKQYLDQFVNLPNCPQKLRCNVTPTDFVQFLQNAFANQAFEQWLGSAVADADRKAFGKKNADIIQGSKLNTNMLAIYRRAELASFGKVIFGDEQQMQYKKAIQNFSNIYRTQVKLANDPPVMFGDEQQNIWLKAVTDSLGESLEVKFALQVLQNFLNDFSNQFSTNSQPLAEWYFNSTYSNPSSTESLAVYLFKRLDFMTSYKKNKDWLMNDLAKEVFCIQGAGCAESDMQAYQKLVDQIPNLYLYIRSGMVRSGNDLSRALSDKDGGYLSNNFVRILSQAYQSGYAMKVIPLMQAWLLQQDEDKKGHGATKEEPDPNSIANRRKLSQGADALKRVMAAFLQPETEGNYDTCLLHNILVPIRPLMERQKRKETETFLLTVADEILNTPDAEINNFFDSLKDLGKSSNLSQKRETLHGVSDLLKNPNFPEILTQFKDFFDEDAVRPALNFLAQQIQQGMEDGSLDRTLLFIRRVLGIQK